MVVSPVGATGVRDSTRNWLVHQTNLWNVAITRARSQLIVVGDQSWWTSQPGLLARIAAEDTGEQPAAATSTGAGDQLHRALQRYGIDVRRDVRLAGQRYDVVVSQGRAAPLAVLVDDPAGVSDGRNLRQVLARVDATRGSLQVIRAPAWRCLAEPEAVAAEITSSRCED